ncbi:MAG: ImmA/IrrE family metallo-endopeptidase [Selenomonadaceae bacterium]|nr:ImmA/IrrE family metallo-endopeptidase [Selenomonadaceae bacterium]
MDYTTKSLSRATIRKLAPIFRFLFKQKAKGPFHVLKALELLPDVFPSCNYEVVPDRNLPSNVVARCFRNDTPNGYTVTIKETVYKGAYRGNGACLGFICHELCHIFLFNLGFTPVHDRSFEDNTIPAYGSVEWQAKALCGEVMIPHEESKGMSYDRIIDYYHVSKGFANHRLGIKYGR